MKRHLLWFVEVFLWILILFGISSGIIVSKYNSRRALNTYQIFLPDVDGLINGSPVKIMGIQVGYVNQLDIVGDDVYVKFIITEPHVRIPRGAIATVEFSGLGGSKSLEIYPPTSKDLPTDKFIISQSPKRIHDSVGLLSDMYDQVMAVAYNVSSFMTKVGVVKEEKEYNNANSPKSADEVLNGTNAWLDKMQQKSDKFNDKLDKAKEGKNGQNYGKIDWKSYGTSN